MAHSHALTNLLRAENDNTGHSKTGLLTPASPVTVSAPVRDGPAVGRWTQLSARARSSSGSSFHLDILYLNMLVPVIHSDSKKQKQNKNPKKHDNRTSVQETKSPAERLVSLTLAVSSEISASCPGAVGTEERQAVPSDTC